MNLLHPLYLPSPPGGGRRKGQAEIKNAVVTLPIHELKKDVERKEISGIRFFPGDVIYH